MSSFIVAAESASAAADEAEQVRAWFESFNYLYARHGRGPMLGAQPTSFAQAQQLGRAISGTPAQIADFLCHATEVSDVNYVVGQFAFGDMAPDFAMQPVGLFAEHVMPRLRRFGESRAAAMTEV